MPTDTLVNARTRPVAIWLLVGVCMIMGQVWLGGVTRLTGSGLSITEWDPIMGAIPPLSHEAWEKAFHLYQQTPQYQLENRYFTLQDFKRIYFWEWLHRLWARALGVVFIAGFVVFLIQRRFTRGMVGPLVILFLLGGLQGLVGWIMVKSGLTGEHTRVNHIKLAIHFLTAMVLLVYTFWFALLLLVRRQQCFPAKSLRVWLWVSVGVLIAQLAYGSFMAGLHAAMAAPTWPDINGYAIPSGLWGEKPPFSNLVNNVITVQFIHRLLAYVLFILLFVIGWKARKSPAGSLLRRTSWLPFGIACLQILLGVLTVIHSHVHIPIALAVSHQFVGMLLLLSLIWMFFISQKPA
ncbi:MAG: COX15/CtaA family protein [Thermoflavifilum aggregans]|nr:COX15/CtaA family protein [Thermoflavifilum aggregans]